MTNLTRRTLLKLTAASIPVAALGCGHSRFDPQLLPESITRFPRTPIAGDMTQSRFVITFYVADNTPVTLRVWDDVGVLIDRDIAPNEDGFHKAIIDNLSPGTRYEYALFSGKSPKFDSRSLIGTVRTANAPGDMRPIRIALLSCIGQGSVLPDFYFPESSGNETTVPFEWDIFKHADQHTLDALIHLGDQAYLDFVWSSDDPSTEHYLKAWGFYHGGGYRDLYPQAGLYCSWDDHEVTDNKQFNPWEMAPQQQIAFENAQTAWYKVMPIDAMTPSDGTVWRNFVWGDTLEIILLDCRYELQADHLLSEQQLTWLLDRIENSSCRFICVATPKPFSKITSSQELLADNADRWDGYPNDRARLTELIDRIEAKNIIFVCGDIHMNYLGRASLSGTAVSDTLWEVCTTTGNRNPLSDSLSTEQFDFVNNAPHFPVLTFDPVEETIHVAFYSKDGTLSFDKTIDA